jgi:2-haloacid dehalogenase
VEFTRIWRAKQFEYCYLRTITGRFADFSLVTEDALVYAAEAMHLELKGDTRQRLLNAYLNLKPWPDAADGLRKLRAAGVRIITISVFSGGMLRANAEHAGIADLFDELLSTEVNQTYKPDPRAYALGMERLHLKKDEIAFAAFGACKPLQRAGGRIGREGRRHVQRFSGVVGFRAGEVRRVAGGLQTRPSGECASVSIRK